MIDLTPDNFEEEVLSYDGLVIVDCWSTRCSSCRRMAPILDLVESESPSSVKFAKLNAEEVPGRIEQYQVYSMPTFLFFKKGALVARKIGACTKDSFKLEISKHV